MIHEMKQLISKVWKDGHYGSIAVLAAYHGNHMTEIRVSYAGRVDTITLPNDIAKELGLALCAIGDGP